MTTATTQPSEFEVPVNADGNKILIGTNKYPEAIFVQAITDGSNNDGNPSPGAWGFVRIFKEKNVWYDGIFIADWDSVDRSDKSRLEEARNYLVKTYPEKVKIFNSDPPGGVKEEEKCLNLTSVIKEQNKCSEPTDHFDKTFKQLFGKITDKIRESDPDREFSKSTSDGFLAEKLVHYIIHQSNPPPPYRPQQIQGYDLRCPTDTFHEVKSFKGNSEIHFTSAQLEKMGEEKYFVWLVKKVDQNPPNLRYWKICKLKGTDVLEAIRSRACSKFKLTDLCAGSGMKKCTDARLSVGVKFDFSGIPGWHNGQDSEQNAVDNDPQLPTLELVLSSGIDGESQKDEKVIPIPVQDVKVNGEGSSKKVTPLTAEEWFVELKIPIPE